MRISVLALCFAIFFSQTSLANYEQSKAWFYSQSYEDRISIQLLLIFTGDYVALVDAAFGKRTYEGLQAFQYREGFQPDGVLNKREFEVLAAKGGSVMQKIGFEFRDEPTSGVRLGIPEKLFVSMEPVRRGVRWAAKNEKVELETLNIPNYETSYRRLYQRLATQSSKRRVEYKVFRNDYFVVSGINRGKNFYIRVFRTQIDSRGFSLSWNKGLDALMDRVAVAMSNSLTFYDGATSANLPKRPNQNLPTAPKSGRIPKKLSPSNSPPKTARSSGSGYFVTKQGHIATNAHVVEGCRTINVVGHGSARVLKADTNNDLAIVRVETNQKHSVATFRPIPVRRGEEVYVLGFPFAAILGNNLTISEGIVSSPAGIGGDVRNFSLSAPVQPGNSGGPVLDASGTVIGTVVAKLDAMKTLEVAGSLPENINFAVQGNLMATLMASANLDPVYSFEEDVKSAADVSSLAEKFTVQIVCNAH